MKYVAALLLGLASVNGSQAFTNLNNMFNGTPETIINTNDLMVTQTLDWDVDYGTFFTPDTGSDTHGDFVSQTYGAFAEFYVSLEYQVDFM